jgi:hypothetical protein
LCPLPNIQSGGSGEFKTGCATDSTSGIVPIVELAVVTQPADIIKSNKQI